MKLKKRAFMIMAACVFIVAVAVLYTIIFAIPKIQGLSLDTEIVEYADLPVQDTVEGLFVRNETLYSWPTAGVPQYLIAEGTKVRRGMQVFWVDAASAPEGGAESAEAERIAAVVQAADGTMESSEGGVAPVTAIVSYFGDGYEKEITPETMHGLDKGLLAQLPAESTDLTRTFVGAGEPVYRITDNNLWYVVFWKERTAHKLNEVGQAASEAASGEPLQVEGETEPDVDASEGVAAEAGASGGASAGEAEESTGGAGGGEEKLVLETGASIEDYEAGRLVTLDLGTTRVTAKVESVEERPDGWFVVLSSDMYYRDLVKYRKKVVSVIFEEYSGAVIGQKALVEQDGQAGVFVRQQSGTWKWVPVNILRRSGGKCLVSENTYTDAAGDQVRTVNYYDEVMSDPVKEGYSTIIED
ncbi:MAG: hypothetical protein LBR44_04795 [Clostridiales Family XIII bacterium]|jgi:hypothetical protein|nr:hypothetical protein [Clostridiales Family XIII bacterium]